MVFTATVYGQPVPLVQTSTQWRKSSEMFLYFYKYIFDLTNHTLRTFGLGKRTF